ncbi:hypothetical protein [Arthrobacter sp. C9C5]|uniref:hypothetical protein n=1 Tax=Arthrobacter sp. C9C5 TaxID=2735267 RepID=UPI001585424B|nr:hypothetical protein [Arthrobacter sp. C9C5]NUU33386.1 hypothetical protein [Arthrobacter sp. C9C5]
MNTSPQPVSWELLNAAPSTVYERLIVQWPYQTDRDLAFFYSESANRLASTFSGKPIDDTILLPFLTLYRQAFELQLKSFTRYLAAARRKYREPSNPALSAEEVNRRLRGRAIGHKLQPLLEELLEHYAALNLSEPFPQEVQQLLLLIHHADEPGTYFRYSGNLPAQQTNVDFPNLVARFKEQFNLLQAAEDWAEDHIEANNQQP